MSGFAGNQRVKGQDNLSGPIPQKRRPRTRVATVAKVPAVEADGGLPDPQRPLHPPQMRGHYFVLQQDWVVKRTVTMVMLYPVIALIALSLGLVGTGAVALSLGP